MTALVPGALRLGCGHWKGVLYPSGADPVGEDPVWGCGHDHPTVDLAVACAQERAA